ncbi:major facilitator superfamily domain-containing protein [Podospora didyma]|uniref:Major facilitator superfamily domain-containing protein n=1 Tax=Podospora didyma TaxID=330526 RepID=A0AAE0K4P4_9PEZI|nr:major facilitator superfamily domain-containing protein [Podospora didyma]
MPGWKYAFSLSREAVKGATPPGTVRLIEHSITQHNGRYVDRVANFPVPTSDPADPLNWAQWRKVCCLATVSLYAFVSNFASASLAPALPIWNLFFPQNLKSPNDLMQFIAFNVLLLGLGNVFWVPLANVFGRRPMLVLSTLALLVASACGTVTANFHHVLVIRIFQGLGGSASETIAPAVVGDMFFVHERGGWMAFYTAFLASGSVVGGISGGYIATRHGWFSLFEVNAVLSGIAFLCTLLLVPETIYQRESPCLPLQRNIPRTSRFWPRTPAPYLSLVSLPSMHMTLPSRFVGSIDQGPALTWYQTSSSGDLSSSTTPARFSKVSKKNRSSRGTAVASNTAAAQQPPFTFLQSLKIGMYRGNLLYQFKKPWFTLRLPATWIVMFQYGGLVGAVAVMSTVGPQILDLPPYQWGENSGLLFIGALIGIVFGGLFTSLLADKRLKALAKNQDHGYAEPESRIPIILPSLAIATGGLLVFGFCAEYPGRYQWVGLEFAYGMVAFALAQVPSIWFSYLIDAYAQLASDCFVMICILRGIVPFTWTLFVSEWVAKDGFLIPFGGFTVMMGVFSLLILPLIWMGKRMRIATARYVVGNQ